MKKNSIVLNQFSCFFMYSQLSVNIAVPIKTLDVDGEIRLRLFPNVQNILIGLALLLLMIFLFIILM